MPKITSSYRMPHKRRLRGKTDYRKRLALVKSGLPRAVVRRSSGNISIQIIRWERDGDKVLASACSAQLGPYGWKAGSGNVPAAYLTGLLAGLRSKKAGAGDAVLDMGLQASTKGSRIYAALKGMTDAGLKVPHDAKMIPDAKRLSGQHIAAWAAKGETFTKYGVNATDIQKHFEETKARIAAKGE